MKHTKEKNRIFINAFKTCEFYFKIIRLQLQPTICAYPINGYLFTSKLNPYTSVFTREFIFVRTSYIILSDSLTP